jgi:hypothetical protein
MKRAALVGPGKVVPPFRIKLGAMKYLVKSVDKDGEVFRHLSEMFPQVSEAKKESSLAQR